MLYIVCLSSGFVRDAQYADTCHMSNGDFDNFDICDDSCWYDIEPSPFIDVVEADNPADACFIAGKARGYDPRTLYAFEAKASNK